MDRFGTFSRREAADYLGVSLPLLDKYLHRDKDPIPSIRTARRYLIPRASLETWITNEAGKQRGDVRGATET